MRVRKGRNSVGVGRALRYLPKVASSSQPWALRRNPVGIWLCAWPGVAGEHWGERRCNWGIWWGTQSIQWARA
jgi:hypothetical protein